LASFGTGNLSDQVSSRLHAMEHMKARKSPLLDNTDFTDKSQATHSLSQLPRQYLQAHFQEL